MVTVTIPQAGRQEGTNITNHIIHNEVNSYLLNSVAHHFPTFHQLLSEKPIKPCITQPQMMEALLQGHQVWQKEIMLAGPNQEHETIQHQQAAKGKGKTSAAKLATPEEGLPPRKKMKKAKEKSNTSPSENIFQNHLQNSSETIQMMST